MPPWIRSPSRPVGRRRRVVVRPRHPVEAAAVVDAGVDVLEEVPAVTGARAVSATIRSRPARSSIRTGTSPAACPRPRASPAGGQGRRRAARSRASHACGRNATSEHAVREHRVGDLGETSAVGAVHVVDGAVGWRPYSTHLSWMRFMMSPRRSIDFLALQDSRCAFWLSPGPTPRHRRHWRPCRARRATPPSMKTWSSRRVPSACSRPRRRPCSRSSRASAASAWSNLVLVRARKRRLARARPRASCRAWNSRLKWSAYSSILPRRTSLSSFTHASFSGVMPVLS